MLDSVLQCFLPFPVEEQFANSEGHLGFETLQHEDEDDAALISEGEDMCRHHILYLEGIGVKSHLYAPTALRVIGKVVKRSATVKPGHILHNAALHGEIPAEE